MRRIRYRRGPKHISVTVPAKLLSPICTACNKTFEGRRMNTHHWREEFTFDEVRADHLLALQNSIRACVPHHRIANDLREIVEQLQKDNITLPGIANLVSSMPPDMKETFMGLVAYLE